MSLGDGVWGWVQVGGGGWFPCKNKGMGRLGGGTGKGTGTSMLTRLSKLPFSKLPFYHEVTNQCL